MSLYEQVFIVIKIVSKYDQEIPQSQTADKPMAPRKRATQPSQDTKKTNEQSEYDQEIPQSQTADKPMAPRGRATQPSRDIISLKRYFSCPKNQYLTNIKLSLTLRRNCNFGSSTFELAPVSRDMSKSIMRLCITRRLRSA